MNRLLASTAIALVLGLTPALAADQPGLAMPSDQPAPAPMMQPERVAPATPVPDQSSQAVQPAAPAPAAPPPTAAAAQAPTVQFLDAQKPDDWLTSSMIDKPVVNPQNERIGDLNDFVTDASGKVIAAVIGVGGFLGIGEKDVAVPFQDLKLARDQDDNVTILLNISKDELAAAPDYKTLDEQEVVEGAAKSDRQDTTRTY